MYDNTYQIHAIHINGNIEKAISIHVLLHLHLRHHLSIEEVDYAVGIVGVVLRVGHHDYCSSHLFHVNFIYFIYHLSFSRFNQLIISLLIH